MPRSALYLPEKHPPCRQVVPADYAFVLHTANPITGSREELFGEVVVGMGESLVGNTPGRALSFTSSSSKGAADSLALLSLPSKRTGLFSSRTEPNLIFRSDSNGEDLEAFAGAGEYFICSLSCIAEFQSQDEARHSSIASIQRGLEAFKTGP